MSTHSEPPSDDNELTGAFAKDECGHATAFGSPVSPSGLDQWMEWRAAGRKAGHLLRWWTCSNCRR